MLLLLIGTPEPRRAYKRKRKQPIIGRDRDDEEVEELLIFKRRKPA